MSPNPANSPRADIAGVYKSAARTPVMGRLFSLSHYSKHVQEFLEGRDPQANQVVINFPSMPDSIDLLRAANYKITPTPSMPDGAHHQYTGTDIAEIPFSFKVHAYDDYCPQGSLTLLHLAGQMHALTLPVGDSSEGVGSSFVGVAGAKARPAKTEAEQEKGTTAPAFGDVSIENSGFIGAVSYPVAVKLELMYIDVNTPGISCIGYIKSVNVKLIGPFLSQQNARNLPTALECSFVFVHRPSHTNNFGSAGLSSTTIDAGIQYQAYADDVKSRLYNTVGLVRDRPISYRGLLK